jgi:hypothetical protein
MAEWTFAVTVISIQSQVAHGHVGFLGIEVAAMPTVLFSNHSQPVSQHCVRDRRLRCAVIRRILRQGDVASLATIASLDRPGVGGKRARGGVLRRGGERLDASDQFGSNCLEHRFHHSTVGAIALAAH